MNAEEVCQSTHRCVSFQPEATYAEPIGYGVTKLHYIPKPNLYHSILVGTSSRRRGLLRFDQHPPDHLESSQPCQQTKRSG